MTPKEIQATLDAAIANLKKATKTYPAMVKLYGSDWTKWPKTTSWYQGLSKLAIVRAAIGAAPPVAAFTWKEK